MVEQWFPKPSIEVQVLYPLLGYSQVARRWSLTPRFRGSNPLTPMYRYHDDDVIL